MGAFLVSEIGPRSRASSMPGLSCSRKHQQVHISMVTEPGLSSIPELSESRGKKRKKNPPSGQIGFLLGQGTGIGILSLDSHPWKRLTPSCGRACIFCYFRLKGETSNGPYSYGLPWVHRPLHRRRIPIRPLPASQGASPAVTRGGF